MTERRRRVDPRFSNTDSTAALKITCLVLIRPCPNIVLKYQDSNVVRLNTWLRFEYWAIFVNINSNIASNILLITFLVMERVKLNVVFITSVTTLMTHYNIRTEQLNNNSRISFWWYSYRNWNKHFHINLATVLHKKWSFPLRISSVSVTKSAWNCGFGHIYWRNP